MIKALLSLHRVTTSSELVCKELPNSPRLRFTFSHCLTRPNRLLANHNALNYRPYSRSQLPFYLPTPTVYNIFCNTIYIVIQNFSKNNIKQDYILNIVVT